MEKYRKLLEEILKGTGITFNGPERFDLQVLHEGFYKRVFEEGSLGLGESYMDGWWDCENLDQFFAKILKVNIEGRIKGNFSLLLQVLKAKIFNQQTRSKSKAAISKHYNVGNDLYQSMLDSHMMYSCGYWEGANNLEEAQTNKLELICQKLKLEPGMKVLDIGCGWGGFAAYAARHYQVEVLGVTISSEQAKLAKERCEGLSVEIRLQDYRDVQGKFDRILSIGMMEHVGHKNHPTYMRKVHELLKDNGISLLHTIGSNVTGITTDPWIDKYIFSNSLIPSISQLSTAMEPYFVMEDWHNFGLHYDYTLMGWLERFKAAWPELKQNYDDRFYRMWVYYLCCSAGSFRARKNNLWQVVMVKRSYPGEYKSIRTIKEDSKVPSGF